MNDSGPSKSASSRFPIYLLLAIIVGFNFFIRWHLRDMPLERDEGEYAYAGQLILQGVPPYQLAYNMKFPGTYFAYALLMAIFGQSAVGIHIGIILVTSITAILVFLIGCELLSDAGGLLAAATFVLLSALPKAEGLAGHATHFVSLFVCAGVFTLLVAQKKKLVWLWLASGVAFGLAILMKQHAVFFPAFILVWFIWTEFRRGNLKAARVPALLFCGGCVVPFLITAIGFACARLWGKFIYWTFDYARQYVSILPLRTAPEQFVTGFGPVFMSGMAAWFAGIAGMLFLLRPRPWKGPAGLAALLFIAGLAAACPGLYFRNHYFLMAMPGLALLNAIFILTIAQAIKNSAGPRWLILLPACLVVFILGNLIVNNCEIWFAATPLEASRQLYGTSPYPEAVPVAEYLKKNTSPSDTIAVLGSEPEIFFLTDRRSASGYIYLYSLTEPQPLASQMREQFMSEIEAAHPQYILFMNNFSSWYSVIVPDSFRSAAAIQNWWNDYSTNYLLTAAVKISADKPSQFFWDPQALSQTDFTNDDILIYRHK